MGKFLRSQTIRGAGERVGGTRRIAIIAMLVCVALMAGLLESAFPPLIPLAPGAKLGLSNIAPLLALILLGVCDAYLVMLVKCFINALLSGMVTGLMYSVPSGVLSLTVEVILFLLVFDKMSVAMISLIGAIVFNAVQLVVASLVTGVNMITLFPILAAAGVLAGAFTGLLTYNVIKKLPYSVINRGR